jgi:two-component system copper resistance phosphate regulon response regulator CusR/two-component system response regulator QseB
MDILIVEDDNLSALQLKKLLEANRYDCDVAKGYKEADDLLDKNKYALILLDWNLGDGDGLELLQELRAMSMNMPVLMLSANSEIDDRVKVLDSGADDYLCKPYSHIELLARIRALLRRDTAVKVTKIDMNGVLLDERSREVFSEERPVTLTTAEFDLLELFMKNPNQVLTRYQLSEHINKDNYAIKHSNLVDVHIKNIRKKLNKKEFIKSVRGIGYKIDTLNQ